MKQTGQGSDRARTTVPPTHEKMASPVHSLVLHFFVAGFAVPDVDVPVSIACAVVISLPFESGVGVPRSAREDAREVKKKTETSRSADVSNDRKRRT